MSQAKHDFEKAMFEDAKSGKYCKFCNVEIPKSELQDANQGDGTYICSYCRQKLDKLKDE